MNTGPGSVWWEVDKANDLLASAVQAAKAAENCPTTAAMQACATTSIAFSLAALMTIAVGLGMKAAQEDDK